MLVIESKFIKTTALESGFDICGIAAVHPLDDSRARFESWLSAGNGGGLAYLERNIDKRFSPSLLLEGAASIIVCGVNCKNDTTTSDTFISDTPKIAAYACTTDYHITIKRMLQSIAGKLEERYGPIRFRAFTDSAPLHEKRWAIEAGLGWQGRNSLLINPHYGTFLLLGELLVDRTVDTYDTPFEGDGCAACHQCMEACPNAAILPGRNIDTRRCISRLTIEKSASDDSSRDSETALHGWIFGCDACQLVCPWNRHTPLCTNPEFKQQFDPRSLTYDFWSRLGEEEFERLFASTPLSRCGLSNLKKNLPKP